MSGILDSLTSQLGGDVLKNLSGRIGADEKSTGAAVSAALPMLLGAMARNSRQPTGAQSLSAALSKDHDGSILDDLPGFLGRGDSGPGAGILRHVLGGKQTALQSGLSRTSGVSADSMGKLLPLLAPIVMGYLGRQQRQNGMDANGLSAALTGEAKEAAQRDPNQMGALSRLLDSDGDGDVDFFDLAKGAGSLGKLFG